VTEPRVTPPDGKARHPGRRKAILHACFGALGLGALGLLVRSVGVGGLVTALRTSARWLPVLFAIQAARVALEAATTFAISERVRQRVRLPALARVHVVGNAVAMVMPAGRAAAEAVKAAMLSRFVGAPDAAAIGATNQSMAMLGSVLIAVPCTLAALALTGLSAITLGLLALTVVSAALLAVLQVAVRRREIGGFFLRRVTHMEQATEAFRDAIARIPVFPPAAVATSLAGRALNVVELGVLLHAVGGRHGPAEALLALGVNMLGGSVGDFVPGQLGATDGAFALAAPSLGLAVADGVAMAMTLHLLQITWALLGWTLPLWWKAGPAGGGGLPAEGKPLAP
jgi:uncharacterized membrane protein YbhN (UPF0104 family)